MFLRRFTLLSLIGIFGIIALSFSRPAELTQNPESREYDRNGSKVVLGLADFSLTASQGSDSTQINLDKLIKEFAQEGRCRVTTKITDTKGTSYYSGYDGRIGQKIEDFSHPFDIGSCTKMFTATAILQLVEQKKIKLDDRLTDILNRPQLLEGLMVTDSADYLGEVRLKNLLNHTSGLPEYFLDDDNIEIGIHGDSTLRFTPEQLVGMAKRLHQPQFQPGMEFKYTNTNYILLGMILEQHSGQTFQAYITENIIEKAGLKDTYFPSQQKVPGRSKGHWNNKPSQMPATLAGSAGEIVSTLDDMERFIRAWAAGQFFETEQMTQLVQKENFNPMGMGIQYGLGVIDLGGSLGHAGQTFGFQAYMGFLPNNSSFTLGIDDASQSAWNLAFALESTLNTP